LCQDRTAICTREAEGIAQVAAGQIVELVNLVKLLAEHLFKPQAPLKLIGHFIGRLQLVLNVNRTRIVFVTGTTQSPAAATQALQVVAPDLVLQQLKQRAFMARQKDVQAFALGLPGQIKRDDFLFNILWVLAKFYGPFL